MGQDKERRKLLRDNIIHEIDREIAVANSRGLYGRVLRKHYQRVIRELRGTRVLDCGCGFGLLTSMCREAGFSVRPIDVDEVSIELAHEIHGIEAENTSLYDVQGEYDVALFFDVISHLSLDRTLDKLREIDARQVILSDSNLANLALRLYRSLHGHEEHAEWSRREIVEAFGQGGYSLRASWYYDVLGLPLGGGFLRRPLPFFEKRSDLVCRLDDGMTRLAAGTRLDRWAAFRYLLVFER
ncbi:class I SAM-dependent methyltransferase [Desulfohalovibrio reitneri]|uniref:class I SAM-dependent methyltransferase n=1 Tax=Desulfohalovibrio reitneri TaxID=1307759 RepID=UPI0004A6E763|nr:methyltransferase domain-containing protein [Desulfohalovibrio reitneri]